MGNIREDRLSLAPVRMDFEVPRLIPLCLKVVRTSIVYGVAVVIRGHVMPCSIHPAIAARSWRQEAEVTQLGLEACERDSNIK